MLRPGIRQALSISLLPPVPVDSIFEPRNTNEDPSGWWNNLDVEVSRKTKKPEAPCEQNPKEYEWVRQTLRSQGVYNLGKEQCTQAARDSDKKKKSHQTDKSWLGQAFNAGLGPTLSECRFSGPAKERRQLRSTAQHWRHAAGAQSVISRVRLSGFVTYKERHLG